MKNRKNNIKLKKAEFSPRTKKIITTVAITLAVCLFFIWLGAGMYISVPEEERSELLPMFFMYSVFPLLIVFFGAKRIYIIVNFGEDPEMVEKEEKYTDEKTENDDIE